MMKHKIIKNKTYSSNKEDVDLCIKLALNTSLLNEISGLDVYNYKINKINEIYIILKENGITMDVANTINGNKLITFCKDDDVILQQEVAFYYM